MRTHLQSTPKPLPAPPTPLCPATISYARETMIRAKEAIHTAFHDHYADLRDPARKIHLRKVFAELDLAIKGLA